MSKGLVSLFALLVLAGCAANPNGTAQPQQGFNAPSRAPTNSMQYMYRSPPTGFTGAHGR